MADFVPTAAKEGFTIPELPQVWTALEHHEPLSRFVEKISRGLRWNRPMVVDGVETGNRDLFIKDRPLKGFLEGVAPDTKFSMFEVPRMRYLSIRPEDREFGAWAYPWKKPKVIFNKSGRSRGHWKIAAFPDREGVSCYQTYIAAWPTPGRYDEIVLAAILNSPVANAFVATREGKVDVTIETLKRIPMPVLGDQQRERLRELVVRYQAAIQPSWLEVAIANETPAQLLLQIDAIVLEGYRLPPRIERELLDFFNGHRRPTSHSFPDYYPHDDPFAFSLSRRLQPNYGGMTAGELLHKLEH